MDSSAIITAMEPNNHSQNNGSDASIHQTPTPQGYNNPNPPVSIHSTETNVDLLLKQLECGETQEKIKHMDIQLVIAMFKDLKSEITSIKKDTNVEAICGVTFVQDQQNESIKKLQDEVKSIQEEG